MVVFGDAALTDERHVCAGCLKGYDADGGPLTILVGAA